MELEDYECSVCTGGCAVWDGEPDMKCPKVCDDLVKWENMDRNDEEVRRLGWGTRYEFKESTISLVSLKW